MDAARSGDLQKLKQLINSNANINVQDVVSLLHFVFICVMYINLINGTTFIPCIMHISIS